MGSGIALACLENNLKVVLKDVSRLIAERGQKMVSENSMKKFSGAISTRPKKENAQKPHDHRRLQRLRNLRPGHRSGFRKPYGQTKGNQGSRGVPGRLFPFCHQYRFYSHHAIGRGFHPPGKLCRLHFFHPAHEVPLVEIVRGSQTTDETIARAIDFAKAIQKTPIVVKDDWGFYAARVQNTFILEGITMLQEGYPAALIENLGRQAGMPRSPLQLADALSLPLVLKYEKQAAAHYGSKYIQHPAVSILTKMIDDLGRTGRNKKTGFYDYTGNGQKSLWPELIEHYPTKKGPFDHQEIIDRLLIAQVLEAAWCLQEGVLQTEEAANLGSIYGWGFPAFKGGVVQYMNEYDSYEAFKKKCSGLSKKYGHRFKVPSMVKELMK
jgi:3-hydroxyacyl-CoA dehydrogenase/enoyl-CoA hydratase/3-hydroxybutyryl-CoA epimerase